jgi:hypothetical protein
MDRLRRSIRAGAVIGTFAIGASASAALGVRASSVKETDLRLRQLRAPATIDLVGTHQGMPETARSLVSASQWGTIRNARLQTAQAHLGDVELMMASERFRTPRAELGQGIVSFDHVSGRAAEIGVALPLGGGLSLQSELLVSHMKWRLAATPGSAFARPVSMAMFGIGIACVAGPSLLFGYQRSKLGRAQSQLDRVAALIGGTRAGQGARLELTSGQGALDAARARWGFTLSSLQRPLRDDFSVIAAPSSTRERDARAEVSMRLAF